MPGTEAVHMGRFELEVQLKTTPERAWRGLVEEIDAWWLPDFRAVGEKSTVRLDLRPGGGLIETGPDGTELVWYQVQMVRPGRDLYLVGHTAPDWGGPAISMLKLSLRPRENECILTISDALIGRTSDRQLESLLEGWRTLFGGGLKAHLER